jgi:hypothetical protein
MRKWPINVLSNGTALRKQKRAGLENNFSEKKIFLIIKT